MGTRIGIGFFIGMTFFLLPWYYLSSGGFQLVDFSVIALFLMFLTCLKGPKFLCLREPTFKNYFWLWLIFILFVPLNFIASGNLESLNLLIQNIYYLILLVCFLVMYFFIYQDNPFKFYQRIQYLLLLSFIIPVAFFILGKSNTAMGGRMSLCFNNPNQLGFFALVSMSIFFYTQLLANDAGVKLNKWISVLVLNISMLFLVLSVTRSAVGMIILYILSYLLIFKSKFKTIKSVLYYLIITGVLVAGIILIGDYLLNHIAMARGSGSGNPNIEQDIYSRAFAGLDTNISNAWYLFFGTGHDRRLGDAFSLEYHNNFINIFSEVGLFGLCVYTYFSLYILKKLYQKRFIYTLPYLSYLFYSMFQFTFRTRMNWLFLAFVIFMIFLFRTQMQLKKPNKA